ncbi:MAG: tetratricopeptide repeat protein [Spirochaetes bacterium]|nr:tetratricopeptide repeat protein [Spirochaetota bacterium]
MKQGIVAGVILVLAGIGLFAYYEHFVRYEREARQLLAEGKLVYERGSEEAVNDSINLFTKIVARYPGSDVEAEAYYYIAQGYEKLNLNRLAYLKYVYIIKNNETLDPGLAGEIRARLARLKMKKRYTEEGLHELMGLLNRSQDRDFRSRIYSELGHAYLQSRELEKSKRMFDLALEENGDNEEAILGKARAYKHLGQDERAYDLYDYYLRYYGDFSNYADDVTKAYMEQVYQSGHDRFRKGRYTSAIASFNRLLKKFPEGVRAVDSLYWIGQSYFAMKKYGTAIRYYDRVLAAGGRNAQDARIKKGYAYFFMKNYDLAAREFQLYLNAYPRGRYAGTAKKWKGMSTREILYRVQNRMVPESDAEDVNAPSPERESGGGGGFERGNEGEAADRAMKGGAYGGRFDGIEYENVGEL